MYHHLGYSPRQQSLKVKDPQSISSLTDPDVSIFSWWFLGHLRVSQGERHTPPWLFLEHGPWTLNEDVFFPIISY